MWMPTLSTRVSDGEFKAIIEFANTYGLTVSDLIKKILIDQACWLFMFPVEDKSTMDLYHIEPAENIVDDNELVQFVNKFRVMVGIRPLRDDEV